jgi:5'-3' exonuclease
MSEELPNKKRLFSLFENMNKKVEEQGSSSTPVAPIPEEKKKMFSLFENIKNEHELIKNAPTKDLNSDVLLVDFLNLFIRCWCVNPAISDEGNLIGAIFGSLKSLGFAIRMLRPTRCIIISDGVGGSLRRRQLYPEYKAHRKTRIRVNRMYEDMSTPDFEEKSVKWQMARLVEYFNCLPVTTMSMDSIEADDAIAVLTTEVFNKEHQKVYVMSSDKDFLQLVNDRVGVWSPTKKKVYGPKEVMDEYGIASRNFVYYRAMDGDTSDNIKGIRGAGLKTIKKAFPMLSEEKDVSIEQLLKYSEDNRNKLKLYETMCESHEILERNYELMQLNDVNIAECNKLKIHERSRDIPPKLNKLQFMKLFNEDKAWTTLPDYNLWLNQTFNILNYYC